MVDASPPAQKDSVGYVSIVRHSSYQAQRRKTPIIGRALPLSTVTSSFHELLLECDVEPLRKLAERARGFAQIAILFFQVPELLHKFLQRILWFLISPHGLLSRSDSPFEKGLARWTFTQRAQALDVSVSMKAMISLSSPSRDS